MEGHLRKFLQNFTKTCIEYFTKFYLKPSQKFCILFSQTKQFSQKRRNFFKNFAKFFLIISQFFFDFFTKITSFNIFNNSTASNLPNIIFKVFSYLIRGQEYFHWIRPLDFQIFNMRLIHYTKHSYLAHNFHAVLLLLISLYSHKLLVENFLTFFVIFDGDF